MSSLKRRIFLYFFRRNGVVVERVNALHAAGLAKLLHCVLRYASLGIVKASRTGVFLLGIVQCPPEKLMDALSSEIIKRIQTTATCSFKKTQPLTLEPK